MGNKPLSGIRVIEVGQLLAGPFAGTLLAYFGAEVIKVEPPVMATLFAAGDCSTRRHQFLVAQSGPQQEITDFEPALQGRARGLEPTAQ